MLLINVVNTAKEKNMNFRVLAASVSVIWLGIMGSAYAQIPETGEYEIVRFSDDGNIVFRGLLSIEDVRRSAFTGVLEDDEVAGEWRLCGDDGVLMNFNFSTDAETVDAGMRFVGLLREVESDLVVRGHWIETTVAGEIEGAFQAKRVR